MASKKLLETDVYPSDRFKVFEHSLMVEMETAKMEHEKVWGIDRVIDLVEPEFRRKVSAQRERIWEASQARDEERLEKAIKGMIAAYKALTRWATEAGIEQMPKIDCMEHRMADGSLMVIVRDKQMATWYDQFHKLPVNRSVWTLAELEVVMNGPTLSQVREIKAALPGSQMVPVEATGLSGFEDMKNDIDISKPFRGTKLFDTAEAEVHAKGGKRGK
jgi:hypothetical protein